MTSDQVSITLNHKKKNIALMEKKKRFFFALKNFVLSSPKSL